MKKNGFTLIELIITIALIAIAAIVVGINMVGMTNKNKEAEYNRIVESIESAAKVYVELDDVRKGAVKNSGSFGITYSIKVIIEEGLIEADLVDPRDSSKIDTNRVVKATYESGEFKYKLQ